MSISTVKAVLWVANLGALGTLGYTLYDWTQTEGEKLTAQVTRQMQQDLLDDIPRPEPPKQDIYPYERVEANFFALEWTGKEPPPVVVDKPVDPGTPAKVKATPIADILKVLYLQVDTTAPQHSVALVKYKLAALTSRFKEPVNLYIGDTLPSPQNGWIVDSMTEEGVVFRRVSEDDDEEPQTARPARASDGDLIVEVGEDGAMMPVREFIPAAREGFVPTRPQRTIERSPNNFVFGDEDLVAINENYLEILSNEVRHRPYRDPRTGTWSGVEILSVTPGSIAAQHGAKSGDVIKSINGTPVNSVQEAIQYVKNNADAYDVWTVVVENSGKTRTVTYQKP
ncbi:PDZ domain-containing protein [Engelhardtia mirabilis]|uniref:PDZ domain-containing protein n=1 Tax=Engelhardtia mirabilis TaxID=2528011 RepID=A0A518BPD1_9BACT|nr:hypothetical protein Pla133_38960 [Planctomycetes bacterium Pla133]QDV03120.1 hypothetical protein Pla86_38950 [Planctomycetes bacterium Pla86]